ncbi:B12-binding domain-containing radical SAM protein [Candidatus Entotheonella palauensis]|uniref:B12-binding domain-containing radical SAM protein n=1 Tax=Candidatus Entotheonella palauensis TaxID=93172 RepID=UPI0015C48427|nr:radical SAM protein [Candidatus Entotheonella palauensis]
MTEILLAHAFFLNNDPKQIKKMRPYPPLGTLYAASSLRSLGYSVSLYDAMLSEGEHEFKSYLEQYQPSYVAFYEDQFNFLNKMCLNHVREATCRMSEMARAHHATVIAAGADVSDQPEAYFAHGVQYALLGEADHTLIELMDILSGRKEGSAETLAGLTMPTADGIRRNPSRALERQPDVFPFPAWDLLDAERYRKAWNEAHGYFSLNMVTTRGCPFHCNWCAKPIWGQRYAMRSPANVAEEMAWVKHNLNPDHIWFADDIFGLRPQWVAEFAREVESRNASIPFMIQSRVDLITEQAVAALARAGCVEVWLGAESGSQKILDAMDKGTKAQEIPVVRERLRQAGIKACFFIQFGYPGETFEDIMTTVQMVRDTLPDDIGVSVSYPLPGTKFYKMVQNQMGTKVHWEESNDLEMMFQGTYQTPFYRQLHTLIHRDLELRQQLYAQSASDTELLQALDCLTDDWFTLGQLDGQYRSADPTVIRKDYDQVEEPDLSKEWN